MRLNNVRLRDLSNKGSRMSGMCELIHAYIWGLYQLSSHDNKRYLLTLVDVVSRCNWVYLIQHKDDSVIVLKMFFARIDNQFHTTIKRFRSHNEEELFNNQLKSFF